MTAWASCLTCGRDTRHSLSVCKVQFPVLRVCWLGPCYLSRPSALTGPSSDLGSGDRELQLVSLQGSRDGQAEGPVVHSPATDQKLLSSVSVQASRAGPVSSACRRAASSAGSGWGKFRMPLRPWKLCSVYSLWGGPACSQRASSGGCRAGSEHSPRNPLWFPCHRFPGLSCRVVLSNCVTVTPDFPSLGLSHTAHSNYFRN